MGAWGELAFDNDTANDWAYDLADARDLSLVESALTELEAVGSGYLDQDVACVALAACQVLARPQGRPGYSNAYTEEVDQWVAKHPMPVPAALVIRGSTAIDRVLGDHSDLRELWEEQDPALWLAAAADLRTRLG